jgi:hypothetical protein
MRQLFFYLSITALALCSTNSECRSAERSQSGQSGSPLRSDTVDLAMLKTSLGASFRTTTTEHFVLLHEAGADYVEVTGRTLENAYRRFYLAFCRAGFDLSRSRDRLVWICFPHQGSFNRYALQAEGMDLSWLEGYYSTRTNRVAIVQTNQTMLEREKINPPSNGTRVILVANEERGAEVGSQTQNNAFGGPVLSMPAKDLRLDVVRLTHELAHQLAFNSGLQKRGVMYPLWVSEGLATNFEYERPTSTGLERCNIVRCNSLMEQRTTGRLIPLKQFVVETKAPADARLSRSWYAQAWAFFHFILTERPGNLRRYLDRLAGHSPGRRDAHALLAEFTEAFGPLEEIESAWKTFLDRQAQRALTGNPAASLTPDTRDAQLP